MATQDWETTSLIYAEETTSQVEESGRLERGWIDLPVATADPVYCRRIHPNQDTFRFWMLEEALVFRITFVVDEDNAYQSLTVSLQSPYPSSFPHASRPLWLQWMEKKALGILQEEEISYSVCLFVQERALEFFLTLYHTDEHHLILFPDADHACYQQSSIVATLGDQRLYIWEWDPLEFEHHYPDGTISEDQKLSTLEATKIFPMIVLWREWLPVHCKICFDTCPADESASITCGHSFCRECITTYLSHKAQEVTGYKTNPFLCPLPECRRGILIVGCVKQFLSPELMNKVREWIKDIKNPPCYSLTKCLKKDCHGILRRVAVDNDIVFCEMCNGRWCELCLQRAPGHQEHDYKKCKVGYCAEFCKRYLAADEVSQKKCEQRFPWIKVYAKSRMDDTAAVEWIHSNGQVCPGCKTGIERSEGCFHITCPCGTHFCYLCGEEIFSPYYGTHHCWERGQEFLPT